MNKQLFLGAVISMALTLPAFAMDYPSNARCKPPIPGQEHPKPGPDDQEDHQKPGGQKPDDQKPDEQKPDKQKPDEQKPDGQKPDEQKPDGQKPDEQKPDKQKPDEQKPDKQKPDDRDDECKLQPAPKGFANFNVVCYYKSADAPKSLQACKVASTFQKAITPDGAEVADSSPEGLGHASPLVPTFNVECDRTLSFNDHARRQTNLLNTRIQALTGPHPAIYLPRGSLHAGFHVEDSLLEIDYRDEQLRLEGQCYIWTGNP